MWSCSSALFSSDRVRVKFSELPPPLRHLNMKCSDETYEVVVDRDDWLDLFDPGVTCSKTGMSLSIFSIGLD